MLNRCHNIGYVSAPPYLSGGAAAALRAELDRQIDEQILEWNRTVPFATHFESTKLHHDYYVRNLIETAWRIRLLRVADAKALVEMAKTSPEAAEVWANYACEEMLHDELFIQDLERSGVSRQTFLATEPMLATKLLAGFFSYLLDHEGPLGVVAYSYLVEYVNIKLDPKKIAGMKKTLGEARISGQISHSDTDAADDHPSEVWSAICHLVRSEQDIAALRQYLVEHQQILAMYFRDLFDLTVKSAG